MSDFRAMKAFEAGGLVAHVRWLLDKFETYSSSVESEWCTGAVECAEMEAERANARAIVEEVIAVIKREALCPGTAGRPGVEGLGD